MCVIPDWVRIKAWSWGGGTLSACSSSSKAPCSLYWSSVLSTISEICEKGNCVHMLYLLLQEALLLCSSSVVVSKEPHTKNNLIVSHTALCRFFRAPRSKTIVATNNIMQGDFSEPRKARRKKTLRGAWYKVINRHLIISYRCCPANRNSFLR